MNAEILIIDDESDIRGLIQGILEDEGYKTREAANDKAAYAAIEAKLPDLVILDIWLQNSAHDGLQILENIKSEHPHMPVLMISGHGTIETAVNAIKEGAYDFIEKPFKSDRLLLMIERALETAKLRQENENLREQTERSSRLVGESPPMTGLRQAISRVAQTNSRILITGEPGTGKDIIARYIHRMSGRANRPYVVLNCAILRPEHLEAALFGSENGPHRNGVLEQAHGGTLLLDEVADMPLETQGKIVRVLQEQRFQRVGGRDYIEVDVRIIASTNRDLKQAMTEGNFRQDLFYRLNVVPIAVPPLRKRPQDIVPLAEHFIDTYSRQSGLPGCALSQSTIAALQAYDWPGNVRQLRNVMEWVMIMKGGPHTGAITPDQLPPDLADSSRYQDSPSVNGREFVSLPLREAREIFERDYLLAQLKRFGGNISKTADFVGMERSALHRKMKQLGIDSLSRQNLAEEKDNHREKLRRA